MRLKFLNLPPAALGVAALAAVMAWPLTSLSFDQGDVDTFMETGVCPGCDLSVAFLDAVVAEGGDISNANLRDASLYRAQLREANLGGADLTGANLTRAILDGADLSNTSFTSADLTDASLGLADTTGAITDATTTCPDGTAGPCDF